MLEKPILEKTTASKLDIANMKIKHISKTSLKASKVLIFRLYKWFYIKVTGLVSA
jgi:hypothetical protein